MIYSVHTVEGLFLGAAVQHLSDGKGIDRTVVISLPKVKQL